MPPERNSATDRDDPRNCNPLFKRLPAEVITRRSDKAGKKAPAEPVKVQVPDADLDKVLEKKPDGRAKWLAKALVQAAEGRLDVKSLYSVVAHKRFVSDLTDKAGKKMYRALAANLHIFSSKQRKFLEKESALAREYAATAFVGIQKQKDESDEEEGKEEQVANSAEEMMARIRGFVREKQSESGQTNGSTEGNVGADSSTPAEASQDKEKDSGEVAAQAATPDKLPAGGRASRSRSDASDKDKKEEKKEKEKKAKDDKDKDKKEKGKKEKDQKEERKRSRSGKRRKAKSPSSSPSRKKSESRSRSRSRRRSEKRSKTKKRKSSSSRSASRRKSKKSKQKASTSSSSASDRRKKKKR